MIPDTGPGMGPGVGQCRPPAHSGRGTPGTGPPGLADRQRELVAALVAGGPPPAGVDPWRFAAAERALRGKRAGEVARSWPLLAAALNSSAPDASAPDASAPVASALNSSAPVGSAPVASAPVASAQGGSAPDASAPVGSAPDAPAPDGSARGETFRTLFMRWAAARPPRGSLRDGWDFARELASLGSLPDLAIRELAARDVCDRYDGRGEPRPRRLPAIRRVAGGWVLGLPGFGACLLRRPSGVLRRPTG